MTKAKPKLKSISKNLTDKQKVEFFDAFWDTWSTNGFGTLTKKDTELLIFGGLKKAFGDTGQMTNYHWATLLRLTPAKIKSLRLEAHLRFGHLFGESGLRDTKEFLEHFGDVQSVNVRGLTTAGKIEDVTVSFVVEDPVVQMIIENSLKDIGTYLDFHRNREVVKLRLVDFFRLVADNKQQRTAINKWVKDKGKETGEGDDLKSRVIATEYASKTEVGKLMTFVDDLAKFAHAKPLTDHIKTIFRSQSERKK